jgi:antitoxin HicB
VTRYTVLLKPEPEGGFAVSIPALPGLHTLGESEEEALDNAREAIELYLEELSDRGEPIPEETLPPHLAAVDI